jgi:hypothetical protein
VGLALPQGVQRSAGRPVLLPRDQEFLGGELGDDLYQGGWGGTVASVVADEGFESLDAPICRVAAACVPLPFADALELQVIPTIAKVVTSIRSLSAY